MTRRPLVIIGGGGHGGCLCDVAEAAGWFVAGFIDTVHEPGRSVLGRPVLGGDERIEDESFRREFAFGLGIGEPAVRRRYGRRLVSLGAQLPSIVHPSAFVSSHAALGQGVLLMGFNAINHRSVVGDFTAFDWHATLGHHGLVGEAAFLSPGVHVAGHVRLGDEVYLGTGCQVVPKVSIGAKTVVGAGATVTADLPSNVLAVGTPAVVKRTLE